MQIAFELPISADDQQKLAHVLMCQPNELPNVLAGYAKAATDEYVQMFLGKLLIIPENFL